MVVKVEKKTVMLNRYYILLTIKLHVSAGSTHHQVLPIKKRFTMCYLCNGVLMKRSHQYSVLWVFGLMKPDDGHCRPKHVVL